LIDHLASLIGIVRHTVESLHVLRHSVVLDRTREQIYGAWQHLHRGQFLSHYTYLNQTESSQQDPPIYDEAQASQLAWEDWSRGIANELAFLSIPNYEAVLNTWRDLRNAFQLSPSTSTPTAGSPFNLTVAARDGAGNLITGFNGTVHFNSTDVPGLPADYQFTTGPGRDNGVHTFTVIPRTAGAQTIRASDPASSLNASSVTVTVRPAAASRFDVGAPTTIQAGVSFPINVTAYDPFDNRVIDYTGTVHITSDDGWSEYRYFGPGGHQSFNVTHSEPSPSPTLAVHRGVALRLSSRQRRPSRSGSTASRHQPQPAERAPSSLPPSIRLAT